MCEPGGVVNNLKRSALILWIIATLIPGASAVAGETRDSRLPETVTIATDEWLPYHSRFLEHYGVGSHIVTEAFKRVGITVKYEFLPWARALDHSMANRVDGVATWGGWLDWIDTHYGSDPVFRGRYVLWTRKDFPPFDWREPSEIKGLRFGNVIGESLPFQFVEAYESGDAILTTAESQAALFKMLKSKRVDILPLNLTVAQDNIRKTFGEEGMELFSYHPVPLRMSFYRVLFSRTGKNSALLWHTFNRGLYLLNREGGVEKMLAASERGDYEK